MTLPLIRTLLHYHHQSPIYDTAAQLNINVLRLPLTQSLNRSVLHSITTGSGLPSNLLHSHPSLLHSDLPLPPRILTIMQPLMTTDQYFISYRCVLSITTEIGLPAKFDTLAIVSNFFARMFIQVCYMVNKVIK